MTFVVIFAAACVFGFVAKRWWSLGLGLVAGVVTLGVAIVSGHANDSPAILVAAIATLGVALGVTIGQRAASPSV